ncbi:SH3 domain-containing protein [Saccharopolyspora sp. HNM0983]|uniref:SH3 domain-containing protein n=1 Tax=Saccharopolyspora montiporae TaxID=2781240 RepID=A0A929B597_9PSEU|nr:SH3 domain-containing protein [Saccharopolyspora sp. HNM0983]MBE9373442.1 SH3 domain-containing protein [Saccharopolyspora sp. HNM0983]
MRRMTAGLALAAGIALSTLAPGIAAGEQRVPTAAPAAGCETGKMPDKDQSKYAKLFKNDFTNIRSGPNCDAVGQGQKSHRVDLHCYTTQWTYLRDVETNVEGWVRNDMLKKTPDAVCPT